MKKYPWLGQNILIMVLGSLLTIAGLCDYIQGPNIPTKESLSVAQGNIEFVKSTGRKGRTTSFKLLGNTTYFVYSSIGGKVSRVRESLKTEGGHISILYDSKNGHSPPFDEHTYFEVYQIVVNGYTIRSYQQLASAHKSNTNLGGIFSLFCAALMVYSLKNHFRNKKEL